VQDGALDDPLEAERGLSVDLVGARNRRRVRGDEIPEGLSQLLDVRGAGAQDFRSGRVVSKASSRCSTVMNSCRFRGGLHEAMWS
jgi:hypothetical protein